MSRPLTRPLSSLRMLLVVVAALCAAEMLMIVLEPWVFNTFYEYDPDMGFRVRAYSQGANRFGFNDRDYDLDKPPSVFRIVVLGDSYNWAGGLEGNYTALLERKFEEHYGRHAVDIISAGYSGTHTGEQLVLLKKFALQYHPDLVLLGFFAGNDFYEADPQRRRIPLSGVLVSLDRTKHHEVVIGGRPIVARLRLHIFVRHALEVLREALRLKFSAGEQGTFSETTFLGVEKERIALYEVEAYRHGAFAARIQNVFDSIAEMQALLKARDIKFMVAIYPDEFSVSDALAQQIFATFNLDPHQYDLTLAQQLVRYHLEALGIPFVDLLNDFRRAQRERPTYALRDTHWNAAGNRLAADLLFPTLVGIVDDAARR